MDIAYRSLNWISCLVLIERFTRDMQINIPTVHTPLLSLIIIVTDFT